MPDTRVLLDEVNIDFDMLRSQRDELEKLIFQDIDSNLWGLVGLLDALIDDYDSDTRIVRVAITEVGK
jgi:hypothetical protein